MTTPEEGGAPPHRLPLALVLAVIGISVAPGLLSLLGVDFGSHSVPLPDNAGSEGAVSVVDGMFAALSGAFLHTILEWSAFSAALFTVILAFIHYRLKGDPTTPIIGVALFTAGCVDAFHTLAATRLIEAVADNRDLIPFTWALSRMFNPLIIIAGVSLFLIPRLRRRTRGIGSVLGVSAVFAGVAYFSIYICATSANLPQTMFPDALITRPYDAVPLVLFLAAGLLVLPKFHGREPSYFSHALLVSVVPEVVTEAHMAFGSTALFDANFNIAHFLKIIAYFVPFTGLVLDYIHTHREEARARQEAGDANVKLKAEVRQRKLALEELAASNAQLQQSNQELTDFASVASHDLQEPLRKVQAFGDMLKDELGDHADPDVLEYLERMRHSAERMQQLIRSLLGFSQLTKAEPNLESVDLEVVLAAVKDDLEVTLRESLGRIVADDLPTILADRTQMERLFQNLISNGLKFRTEGRDPVITIRAEVIGGHPQQLELSFEDNGIGFEAEYAERIFTVFERLHGRSKYAGTGIGLAICRKVAVLHGGEITATARPGEGATFKVRLRMGAADSAAVTAPPAANAA